MNTRATSEDGALDPDSLGLLSPVEGTPFDRERAGPDEGVGLCLSGGGYRAMLFHLGALWRLNELGWLPRLDRVSSVSGGSIIAGTLALNWNRLAFDSDGVGTAFDRVIARPIRELASRTIDVPAVIRGILLPGSIGDRIAATYRRHLFGAATLQDLPDVPRFVINATNLQSGVLWRLSKPYLADYRVGHQDRPHLSLARAVAASSAFPPFLSPLRLRFDPGELEPFPESDLHEPPYTTRVVLSDGGVYDNLGLETVWKRYATVLVSDGGGQMQPQPAPGAGWIRQSLRAAGVVDNQVRSLRKRQVVASFEEGVRAGAIWRIRSHVSDYPAPSPLNCPPARTLELARVRTRLKAMDRILQERLVNWGYAITDVAMRSWVDREAAMADRFPYEDAAI